MFLNMIEILNSIRNQKTFTFYPIKFRFEPVWYLFAVLSNFRKMILNFPLSYNSIFVFSWILKINFLSTLMVLLSFMIKYNFCILFKIRTKCKRANISLVWVIQRKFSKCVIHSNEKSLYFRISKKIFYFI